MASLGGPRSSCCADGRGAAVKASTWKRPYPSPVNPNTRARCAIVGERKQRPVGQPEPSPPRETDQQQQVAAAVAAAIADQADLVSLWEKRSELRFTELGRARLASAFESR